MGREEFNGLLKDIMPHIYDYAALETHPLSALISPPADYSGSRGEYIQRLIFDAIEKLQPKGINLSLSAIEWRPYLILKKRYVEGNNLQELSTHLSLSERQVRRDHNRALQALAGRLWDQAFQTEAGQAPKADESRPEDAARSQDGRRDQAYEIHAEMLDLNHLVRGVAAILQKRLAEEEVGLEINLPDEPPHVLTDRIILRQILLSLFNYGLQLLSGKDIVIIVNQEGMIRFSFQVDSNWKFWREREYEDLLESVRYWSRRLHVVLQETYPEEGREGLAQIELNLQQTGQTTVLVVDDQQPTLRMYQRYLSRSGCKVVGVSDPDQVLPLARKMKPVLITLDIMMPKVDGWEILQALKLDAATRHIPVIICSAWEERELAKSLGAAGFLKKPITQKDLLSALEQLNLSI